MSDSLRPRWTDCSLPSSSVQENWSGLPFSSPGDLPHSGIKPGSLALQGDSLPTEPSGDPQEMKISMLIMPTFLSSVLTARLNKRLVFLPFKLKFPLVCLKDTSGLKCSKETF